MKLNWAERWAVNNPLRVYQQRLELFFLKKKIKLQPRALILEIGCGRGAGAGLILNEFKPSFLHAFDVDNAMIYKAKQYLSSEQKKGTLLSIADIVRIPYKAQLFDAVFIFGVLHHIPLWREALTEISRVLKPGGVFVFEELYPSLYQNCITKHILLHPKEDRFHSDDLKSALYEKGFHLKAAWEIKSLGIVGISEKGSH
ncbi:MAG TPA: class I SAM-dependent methyltransferase [Thermodesulfobacteriota bacterium]|nr:class I SAM-dependent methyltransferase [Thermodesulfobacteriota bacterium]